MSQVKELEDDKYIVKGRATTFNQPYLLYKEGDLEMYEMVDKDALKNADMSDVKFFYNHGGKTLARNINGTLKLEITESGLYFEADLSKSVDARNLYEEIKNGLITEMSWGYIPIGTYYDSANKTRIIKEISKVVDVSAVSYPANKNTYVN